MSGNRFGTLFQINCAVLLFGAAGLFGKAVDLPAIDLTFGRTLFATLILGAAIAAIGKSLILRRRKDIIAFLVTGALLAFHWTAFFQSIQTGSVAIGVLTFATFPAFAALLEPLIFRERSSVRNIVLSAICFAGVALIVPQFDMAADSFRSVLWGMASGASFAGLSLLNRHSVSKYSPLVVTFYQCGIACLCLLPFRQISFAALDLNEWLAVAVLGIVFTGLAHSLFIAGMKHVTVQVAGILASMEPVYGIILAWLILGETITVRMFAGGMIILTAMYFVIQGEKTRKV